jgi:hypothetical protein
MVGPACEPKGEVRLQPTTEIKLTKPARPQAKAKRLINVCVRIFMTAPAA